MFFGGGGISEILIAFIYQEKHHFVSAAHVFVPLEAIRQRDATKKTLAAAKGISLIVIPPWWDGTIARFDTTPLILFHIYADIFVLV